jgi:hypothetical protein
MSNVSTAHNVTAFDSAKSQALSGQRLVKAKYKTTAKVPAKYPNICASIPFLQDAQIAEKIPQLMGCIRAMLETAQDGVFKSLYESGQGVLSIVTDTDLSIDACIGYLEAESTGSRLTKEFLDAWFIRELHETTYALIAEKLGYGGVDGTIELTAEQDATILKHVSGYKDMYSALAGGKTMYQPHQINGLRKVLGHIDLDDTGMKLDKKLEKMLESSQKVVEMIL